MLDGIDVNIVHVLRIVPIIPNDVIPKSELPNSAWYLSLPTIDHRKGLLETLHELRSIAICWFDQYVEVVGKNYPGVNLALGPV